MKHIRTHTVNFDVSKISEQLARHPELWNKHTGRTASLASPHHEIDDIWARYGSPGCDLSEPHESEWYSEVLEKLPEVKEITTRIMYLAEGIILGGVLITRIPAGKCVRPHVDRGWHASYYSKYAVQIAAHPMQAFCFDDGRHVTARGDVYSFDNSQTHWVTNSSPEERITLIVCVRPLSKSI